jgi:hypothetical protein
MAAPGHALGMDLLPPPLVRFSKAVCCQPPVFMCNSAGNQTHFHSAAGASPSSKSGGRVAA